MMAIKKKKTAIRRKPPRKAASALPPPPVPAEIPMPPKPELTKPERRFFAVVNIKNTIGFWLISIGSFFLLGYIVSDKAHLHEKVALGLGFVLILFGAHMLSSEPTERALSAIGKTAVKVLPFSRRSDTAEQKARETEK